ncbi:MAG: ATP-binding protein [Lachnospiraceae bacterium]|nr:ATP-binding protein [Lachnospiraceae bacterium]
MEKMSFEKSIMDALLVDYTAVYYCDLEHDAICIIKTGENAQAYQHKDFTESQSYAGRLKFFYEHFVVAESAPDFMEKLSAASLMEALEEKPRFAYRFRTRGTAVDRQYYEAQVVRIKDVEGFHVVLGFRYIDDVIAQEKEMMARIYEEALEKAKAALKEQEKVSRAKTDFLFNMSHDIRTPMNAIIGFRDLLEKYQDDPVKRQDYLDKIKTADEVLLSIINNVLEMTRIEQGAIELDESAGNVDQFCDAVDSIFKEMMLEKNITFSHEVHVVHPFVYSDTTKVRELFMNLLSNAFKYTRSGGTVSYRIEELPSEEDGIALYRTTVTDNGIGMDASFLPHIFEEFARENNTTDAKVEGTGLGMPIVKRLVDFMHGTIEVQSEKGVGTTVIVTLPHRIADLEDCFKTVDHSVDPATFKGKRILLAEDNELNAEIAIEILQDAGFLVDHAADGEDCCAMLQAAPDHFYDLILMDIQMPRMNGYQAAVAIRKMHDPDKSGIPIVAMTANAFEEDRKEAFRCGMDGHIPKPINARAVLEQLARILR